MISRFWLGIALVMLLSGTEAWADYADTYRRAIRAYEAGDWQTAVDLMRRAREERSNETGRVQIGGNIPRDYLPSYYLGDALMRLRDCAGALEAFARAEQTAAAKNQSFMRRIVAARQDCGTTQNAGIEKELRQAIGQAEPALQQARAARDTVQSLRSETYGPQALQAMNDGLNQAGAALTQAESRLTQARQSADLQAARDADRLAHAALARFQELDALVRTELQRLQRDAEDRATAASVTAEAAAREAKAREEARIGQLLSDGQAGMRRAQEAMNAYDNAAGQRPAPPTIVDARKAMTAASQIVGRGIAAGEPDLKSATALFSRARDTFVRERETILTADASQTISLIRQLLSGANESLQAIDKIAETNARSRLTPAERAEIDNQRRELTRLRSIAAGGALDSQTAANARKSAESVSSRLAELAKAIGQRAAADRGIPPGLVAAARLFFSGHYADARAQLDALALPPDAPDAMRFQAHLLRAAALFGAWAAGGEQDGTLRQAAAEAVAQCKRILPSKEPPVSAFSPRFLTFYRNPS